VNFSSASWSHPTFRDDYSVCSCSIKQLTVWFLHSWLHTTIMGAILASGLSAISNRNIFPEYKTLVWCRNKKKFLFNSKIWLHVSTLFWGYFQVKVARQLISEIWLLYSTILGKLKNCLPQFCFTVSLVLSVAACFYFLRNTSSSSWNTESSSHKTQRLYPNIQFGSQLYK